MTPIRVASVPAGHVYVRHLASPDGAGGVIRLPDPLPRGAPPSGAPWFPPGMLDTSWVRQHARTFDVVHLHFGFDARSPTELAGFVAELRRRRIPLVFTVHDLRNPHHDDPSYHEAQLDVLVPAADALITLTRGAAAAIEHRWRRRATVLPHPHVVPVHLLGRRRPAGSGGTKLVGVHLKSLRAGMDPAPVVAALRRLVREVPAMSLRLDVHCDVMTPGSRRHAPEFAAYLDEAAGDERVELRVHDFFSDVELWDYLQHLDVSVLPYRFGTHSGWLEACHDLGTAVVAPDCGFYAEQHPCFVYRIDADDLDAASVATAVRCALDERPPRRPGAHERLDERRRLAAAHRAIYEDAIRNISDTPPGATSDNEGSRPAPRAVSGLP